MKSLKHSKLKNTGILFELLVRQVTSDTLNNIDSKAIPILKKYFTKSTELSKELNLYQTLIKENFSKEEKASNLISAVKEAHSKLNQSALNRQKYNLIKEIKSSYVLEDFFKAKINEYKILAAVYKLFEYSVADNPAAVVNNKYTLIEHITRNKTEHTVVNKLNEMDVFKRQDKDVRLLSYKLLVDKFNAKYSNLNKEQKSLLREYINSVSNSNELKEFINSEIVTIQKDLKSLTKKVTDQVTKIKLSEVSNLLQTIQKTKTVKDTHILNLLRYHELIKELKKS